MAHLKALNLLMLSSALYVCSQAATTINANDVVLEIFLISEEESKYMEKLMEMYTTNGVLDRERYNEELRRLHPRLYMTMQSFRRTYSDIESQDQAAKSFIDDLLIIARKSRDGEIKQPLETKKILDSFCGLKKRSQEFLKDKLRELKFILKCDKVQLSEESSTTTSASKESSTKTTLKTDSSIATESTTEATTSTSSKATVNSDKDY